MNRVFQVSMFIVACVAMTASGQTNKRPAPPTTAESFDQSKVTEAYRTLEQRQKERRTGQYESLEKALNKIAELEGENAQLRDEISRMKSAYALLEKAQTELIKIYRNRLAKYEPDFVAGTGPSGRAVLGTEGVSGDGGIGRRTENGKVVREFIKTISKQPNESPKVAEIDEELDELFLKLVDLGEMEVDPENAVIRYDPTSWARFSEDVKKMRVQGMSQFMIRHGKSGRLTIRSMADDAEIASYSVVTGVVIKK